MYVHGLRFLMIALQNLIGCWRLLRTQMLSRQSFLISGVMEGGLNILL